VLLGARSGEVLVFAVARAYVRNEAKTSFASGRGFVPSGACRAQIGRKIDLAGSCCGLVRAEENPMGSFSIWHWIVVVVLFLLLFGGRGKISELMGDFAQGIKSFKKGMQDEDTAKSDIKSDAPRDPKIIDHQPGTTAASDLKRRAETETKLEGSTS
jgi:sec-independent protein translocase protein TatA